MFGTRHALRTLVLRQVVSEWVFRYAGALRAASEGFEPTQERIEYNES